MKQLTKLLLTICIFMLTVTCVSNQKKTYVVVCFDVEDYTTPAAEGIDEIPKWLAETMTEVGVTGTFFVIGEKARSLEKRGRQDVIAAMADHDIGSHTNMGSIHPTVTERLEKMNFSDGVKRMLEDESVGFDELQRIFKVPVSTLARHGGSYGPQLITALGQMGAGYVYSPIHLPGHNAVWFCNTLNFHGEYGSFDDSYYRDDLFEPLLDSVKVWLPELAKKVDVISFFGCHPCKVRTVQFWDFNYYLGANPDSGEWKTPELRPLESMGTAQKNFRRLMQFLKSQDEIEITTFRSLMERFSNQKEYIPKKDLVAYTQQLLKNQSIPINEYFTPAELFSALIVSINQYQQTGKVPDKVKRKSPFGPEFMPEEIPEIDELTRNQIFELSQKSQDHISNQNSLPATMTINEQKLGTGSLLAVMSQFYLDITGQNIKNKYVVPAFDVYPKTNENEIIAQVKGCKNWRVHRPDLDMTNLVEMTRLQLWTLKPAHVL